MLSYESTPSTSRRSSGSSYIPANDRPCVPVLESSRRPRRQQSLSSIPGVFLPEHGPFFITPLLAHPVHPQSYSSLPPNKKSRSSPNLALLTHRHPSLQMAPREDNALMLRNDSDDELDSPVSFPPSHVRQRIAPQHRATSDARLPTARIHPPSTPVSPPRALDLIYAGSQALAVIPALLGTLYLVTAAINKPPGAPAYPSRADFLLAAVWAVLTGYQCLRLASGLLTRWRAYYSPLPTLIRLLGLQAICWPATHATLLIVDVSERPLACWALIGSTTCVSRAIQIWVVSNLEPGKMHRRWNWTDVGVKCALPAGVLYSVTAWGVLLQREFYQC
ncbi:hypothetical protein BKA62DRAFT_697007 [Auriculariales sp. MPI-PUGE-AT-0066]|nr:hypothetical protein BKA62DRAFT_697007 [Auriculariales sp. MPI-PUGE-AT-0066]